MGSVSENQSSYLQSLSQRAAIQRSARTGDLGRGDITNLVPALQTFCSSTEKLTEKADSVARHSSYACSSCSITPTCGSTPGVRSTESAPKLRSPLVVGFSALGIQEEAVVMLSNVSVSTGMSATRKHSRTSTLSLQNILGRGAPEKEHPLPSSPLNSRPDSRLPEEDDSQTTSGDLARLPPNHRRPSRCIIMLRCSQHQGIQ